MPSAQRSNFLRRVLPAALLALSLLPAPVGATVYVPMTDGDLADRTLLILEGRVLAVEPAPGERPAVDYLVDVARLIKGYLPGSALVVRVPGGVRPDGIGLHLWGAPRFREGEDVLLFLEPRHDGTFGLHQFMLGAFHIAGEGTARVARRDLTEADRLLPPGFAAGAERPRDLAGFRRWLEDRDRGRHRHPDYFLAVPAAPAAAGKFRTLVVNDDLPPLGCGSGGGHSVRWFDFDFGQSVGWRTYFSGQAGLADGGVAAFEKALEAWNADPNTPIAYSFDGLTGANAGFTVNDGTNTVLFGDPNDEISGSFDGSGLLALGGPWFDCALLSHQGDRFHPVIAADIITQDGLERFFAAVPDAAKAAEQIFGHELGHTLGLAHSQDPEALMRPDYHPDRRGAAPDVDDLAGMLYLYGQRDLQPPVAPSGLTASPTGAGMVRLEWNDLSDNESAFRLERRQAESFELLRMMAADSTSFVDASAEPTTFYAYRLRAQNGAGASTFTGEAEIVTPEDPRPEAPSNLRLAPLSSTEIRLAWQDNSDDEIGFEVEILIHSTWVEIPVALPPDTRRVIAEGLTPGSRFTFRIRAVNDFGKSAPSNAATTETFLDGTACTVSGEELCLLGGRFKVSVRYRNYHAGGGEGLATVVPSTDESGQFWFFGPENIELIVKILDGRQLNQHFWVFYGALSDLEYWITVTETRTGTSRIYHNPAKEICGVADTSAFPIEGEEEPEPHAALPDRLIFPAVPRPAAEAIVLTFRPDPVAGAAAATTGKAGACVPGPKNLCLLDGRLSAEVRWRNPHDGNEGAARAVIDTDNTGFFWFFNIENTELGIKALDGAALNGHLWFFYGALTDLEYWITLTDTTTGKNRIYHNPPGEVCGHADTEAFAAQVSAAAAGERPDS